MPAIILENNMLPIQTVAPALVVGEVMVSADKRSTKEKPLTDAERIRRVVLPAGFWGEFNVSMQDGSNSQGLKDILREAIRKIANDRLSDTLAETPMQSTVAAADFTVSALLAWSEETASSRGSIPFKREEVEAWFTASKTQQNLVAKWQAAGKDAAQMKTLNEFALKRFATLAAKNHGLKDAADAEKLLALVAPEDAETGIGADVVGRIAHIVKSLTSREQQQNLSMDDL